MALPCYFEMLAFKGLGKEGQWGAAGHSHPDLALKWALSGFSNLLYFFSVWSFTPILLTFCLQVFVTLLLSHTNPTTNTHLSPSFSLLRSFLPLTMLKLWVLIHGVNCHFYAEDVHIHSF